MNRDKQSTIAFIELSHGLLCILVLVVLFLSACAFHAYGKFAGSSEVKKAFQTGHVYPEYNYYYSGRENMPYAIIGIVKNYSVPSKYWIRFDPNSEKLKKMAGTLYQNINDISYGSKIMAPDGRQIGIWYSTVLDASIKIDDTEQSIVLLFSNPEAARGY